MIARAVARSLLVLTLLLPAAAAGAAPERAVLYALLDGPHRSETLIIARTGSNPAKLQPRLQRAVDYIVRHLEGTRIRRGLALVTTSNAELLRMLRQGRVDIIPDTLFTALLFRELGGAEILLREWRDGVPNYSTMFITREDSNIHDLDDLRGRRIVFEDETSTSAFRLPLAVLKRHGLRSERLDGLDDTPTGDRVGYLFAGREEEAIRWVAEGLVDAGAISNLDWVDLETTPPELRSRVRLLTMTEPVVRSVLSLRGDLEPLLREEIRRVFLSMHETEDGRVVLRRDLRASRYDAFVGAAQQELERSIELLLPVLDETE